MPFQARPRPSGSQARPCGIAALLAVFALVLPAQAYAFPKTVAGWRLEKSDNFCLMGSAFEGGEVVLFGWDPFSERRSFAIGHKDWDSLGDRTEKGVDLFLKINGNVENDEWWHNAAPVSVSDTGREFVTAYWDREYEEDFLVSFALGSSFSVRIDDVSVGTFTLSGSKAALLELTRCGAELLREKRDPFAR
jgi:hypothetical protein